MHLDLHSAVEMTQLCFASISLSAKELILSEFSTFTYDIPLTECVCAKCGPRFEHNIDTRGVCVFLSWLHCMCNIGGSKWVNHI